MKVVSTILLVISLILVCFSLYLLIPVYFEYRQTKLTLAEMEKDLAKQVLESRELRKEVNALKNDTRSIERVAREKFGLCREGEKVYHFDEPATLAPAPAPPALAPAPAPAGTR